MAQALNTNCFRQPRWLNAARGADPNVTGWPEYNGGIEMPKQVSLRIGQRYFRFASSKADRNRSQLGGPWWIEYEILREIIAFAKKYSSPREAVRYLLAIPWEWSAVDKLVSAILEGPIDAYRGKGKPARPRRSGTAGAHPNDKGVQYTPPQHLSIMQLFIPGLYDQALRSPTELRAKVFPSPHIEDIWTSTYFR